MSTAWAKGSTRSWRQLRLFVLDRDDHRCQTPVPWSDFDPILTGTRLCGKPADTAGHIIAKVHGGQDTPSNLRAECRRHNYTDGGHLAHAMRATIRRWAW